MIKFFLNEEEKLLNEPMNIVKLLEYFKYDSELPFALAINENLIHRSNYESTYIKNGDRIHVVYPMQGG